MKLLRMWLGLLDISDRLTELERKVEQMNETPAPEPAPEPEPDDDSD